MRSSGYYIKKDIMIISQILIYVVTYRGLVHALSLGGTHDVGIKDGFLGGERQRTQSIDFATA